MNDPLINVPEIRVSYEVSDQELRQLAHAVRRRFNDGPLVALWLLFALGYPVSFLARRGLFSDLFMDPWFFILEGIVALAAAIIWMSNTKALAKAFRHQCVGMTQFSTNAEGLTVEDERQKRMLRWHAIRSTFTTQGFLVFRLVDRGAVAVPRRALPDASVERDLVRFIETRGAPEHQIPRSPEGP